MEPKERRLVYEGGGNQSRTGRGKKGGFSMFQTRSRRRLGEEPEENALLLPVVPLSTPSPSSLILFSSSESLLQASSV